MGQDVDQALREIERTRAALERDIDALVSRLPEPAAMAAKAKTYGTAAAASVAVVGLVAVKAKARSDMKADRMRARVNAEELARAFSPTPVPGKKAKVGPPVVAAAAAADDHGDRRGSGLGAVALVASMVGVIIALVTRAQRD